MLKRVLTIIFTALLVLTALSIPSTQAQTSDTQLAEKARADVSKLGVGEKARVEVRLRDNSKLKGYISETGRDGFTLIDSQTNAPRTVAYADVARVKKHGGGISTRTWVIIGAAVAGAIIVGIIVKPAVCDGGAQDRFPC